MRYAKAYAALAAAILGAIVPALYVGHLGFSGWVNVVILACGAIHVFNASNDLPGWEYAKLVAAVVSGAAVAVSSALSDGDVTRIEWIQVAIGALGAFAVYRLPNAHPRGRHEAPDFDDYPRPR